jgi:hypothetical protein
MVVVGFKLIKPSTKANRWSVKARSPVSPVEQQLFGRLLDAFPQCIVLSQVAISQLVSVLPGPDRQAAFNRIGRLVADFVLCTADFAVIGIIELDDSSHAAAHRQNADRNKNEALTAAGYSLVRYQVSKLPTVAELRATLMVPDPNIVGVAAARKQVASDTRNAKSARYELPPEVHRQWRNVNMPCSHKSPYVPALIRMTFDRALDSTSFCWAAFGTT